MRRRTACLTFVLACSASAPLWAQSVGSQVPAQELADRPAAVNPIAIITREVPATQPAPAAADDAAASDSAPRNLSAGVAGTTKPNGALWNAVTTFGHVAGSSDSATGAALAHDNGHPFKIMSDPAKPASARNDGDQVGGASPTPGHVYTIMNAADHPAGRDTTPTHVGGISR